MRSMPQSEPDHPSYRQHRQQVWTQILLPVILAAVLVLAVIVVANLDAFQGRGDSGRWAAISTIWLTIPVLVTCLLFIAVLGAGIFAMANVAKFIPRYSLRAQTLTRRVESAVKQGGEMLRRPQLAVRAVVNRIRSRGS